MGLEGTTGRGARKSGSRGTVTGGDACIAVAELKAGGNEPWPNVMVGEPFRISGRPPMGVVIVACPI